MTTQRQLHVGSGPRAAFAHLHKCSVCVEDYECLEDCGQGYDKATNIIICPRCYFDNNEDDYYGDDQ